MSCVLIFDDFLSLVVHNTAVTVFHIITVFVLTVASLDDYIYRNGNESEIEFLLLIPIDHDNDCDNDYECYCDHECHSGMTATA